MAYSLVGAVARKFKSVEPWAAVDISNMTLREIYNTFARCIVTLSNTFIQGNVYLDLAAVQAQYGLVFTDVNFVSWLNAIGNKALPTTNTAPNTALNPAIFQDAVAAGFKCDISNVNYSPSVANNFPALDNRDVLITKDGIDYSFMARRALITVNGFFHYSGDAGGNGIYAIGAAETWRRSNNDHVGVYSFAGVADLEQIPITPSMIYKQNANQSLGTYTYLNIGRSLSGKTPLLVIGGYLHALDSNTYEVVGDGLIRINFNRIPLLERIFESMYAIDLSSLNLVSTPDNPTQVLVSNVYSDSVIQAYLTIPQSFVVLVDSPSMYRRKWKLEQAGLPGRYYGYDPNLTQYPLIGQVGRVQEYLLKYEWGTWVYCCDCNWKTNYKFQKIDWRNQNSVDGTRDSFKPITYWDGYLLELGIQP